MRRDQRVVLHVGAMKTGTSFVQEVLLANPDALAADGAVFPGERGWVSQVRAARDILDLRHGGATDATGAWARLLELMSSHDGTSVVSMEFLSFAGPDKAARVMESLAPAQVEIVLSVRDAGRVLPAQWQENVQNRSTTSWVQWCTGVTDPSRPHNPARKGAMRALRIPYMLEVWSALVPPERLHVVTVPPAGSDPRLLWRRFADSVGLRADGYHLPASGANESLGHVSAELMRQINARVEDLPARAYIAAAKTLLAKQVLAARAGEPKVVLPRTLVELADRLDTRAAEAVLASGARVSGDLEDLALRTTPDPEVIEVTDRQLLPAAQYAADAMRVLAVERGVEIPAAATGWWQRVTASPSEQLAPLVDDIEASVRAIGATAKAGTVQAGGAAAGVAPDAAQAR